MLLIILLFSSFCILQNQKVKVFLIGDSTMSIKEISAYPETGWGMPFQYFFDSTVVVDNRAKNGRSTKTFISEGRWQAVYEALKEDDYVLIQFGHNDEAKHKTGRYTTPEQYKANLSRMISETREKKAHPILLTPVSRRKFDESGIIMETHPEYSPLVREVALEMNIPLIDLDSISRDLYQKFGPEDSKLLFMHLVPGEHPNYPQGENDNTHFNELGARLIAQMVLKEIKSMNLDLADRIVHP